MSAPLAVEGCTLEIVGGTGSEPSNDSTPSSVVFADGKGVYFKEIAFSVSDVNAGDITNGDGEGSGTIPASGSNILDADGNAAVLEGDISAEITVNGTKPAPGGGTTSASGKIKVKVSAAGQSVVIAL